MLAYLRQGSNNTRVIGPFIDDTDFKTVETGLTINAGDIVIRKNGAAGVFKNSGGATTNSHGMYNLTWNATDTSEEGELTISVLITGTLVVVAKFVVLSQSVYDDLFAITAPGYGVAQTGDTFAEVGTNGAALTALPISDANVTQFLGTLIEETSTGKIAANFDNFYDNADALTTKIVDNVGTVIGSVDANIVSILGTPVTDNAGAATLAGNFSAFYDVDPIAKDVNDVGGAGGTVDANIVSFLGTTIFETTGGTIAANFDNFFDNGDSVTSFVILDHVTSKVNVQDANKDALEAMNLDHLLLTPVANPDVVDQTVIAQMVSSQGIGTWSSFNNTFHSLQGQTDATATGSLLDNIEDQVWDAILSEHLQSNSTGEALNGAGGGGTVNANIIEILGTAVTEPIGGAGASGLAENFSIFFDVNPTTTKTVEDVGAGSGGGFWNATEQANIRYRLQMDGVQTNPTSGAKGDQLQVDVTHWKGVLADDPLLLGDLFTANQALDTTLGVIDSVGDTQAQCNNALVAQNLNVLFTSTYNPASPPGSSTSWANSLVQDKGAGVTQFTADALELAGGASLTLDDIADAVWLEIIGPHSNPGSAAEALIAAQSAGNPWVDDLSTYTAPQAGGVVRDALTGHIPATGDTFVAVGNLKDYDPAVDQVILGSSVANSINEATFTTGSISARVVAADVSAQHTDAVWDEVLTTGHDIIDSAAVILVSGGNTPTVQQIVDGVWDEVITTGHDVLNSAAVILVSGGNVPTVGQIADAVWTEVLLVHTGAGNAAEALISAGTNAVAIAGLNNVSTIEVRTEMVSALTVDIYGEPPLGTPGEIVSLAEKIGMSYKVDINRKDQNATDWDLYNFAGTVIDQKAIITFDGSKTTKAKLTSG